MYSSSPPNDEQRQPKAAMLTQLGLVLMSLALNTEADAKRN